MSSFFLVVRDSPSGAKIERFEFSAVVKRVDLAEVADVILSRFPLHSDVFAVSMDSEASLVIRMASQDPGAAGLRSLLCRVGVRESFEDNEL